MSDRMRRPLAEADPEIAAAVDHEIRRQHEGLEMIASENFVSQAVLEAVGSVFTNKYAEGYPGKRYYGGCEYADVVENLARDRAKQLFGAEHVNVQPHSGSQANAAAYMAVINPGDTILGLDLAHGGHLTHGHKLSFSGKLYRVGRSLLPAVGRRGMWYCNELLLTTIKNKSGGAMAVATWPQKKQALPRRRH